jgi:hypothetical protein
VTNAPTPTAADDAFEAYLASLRPSSETTAARQFLGNLTTQGQLDQEKALSMGETRGFATGEAGRVARQNAILQGGAAANLQALAALDANRQNISQARYEFERQKLLDAAKTEPGFELSPGQSRFDAAGNVIASLPPTPKAPTGSTPLSTVDIQRISDIYGFTPPLGATMAQVTQFVNDNPDATPAELQAGIDSQFSGAPEGATPTRFLTPDFLKKLPTDELKRLSDKAGTSKLLTGKESDINRFIVSVMSQVETARANGYSDKEIMDFLVEQGVISEIK